MDDLELPEQMLLTLKDGEGEIIFICHEPDFPDLLKGTVDEETKIQLKESGARDQLCVAVGRANLWRHENNVTPNCGLLMTLGKGAPKVKWLSLSEALDRREKVHAEAGQE